MSTTHVCLLNGSMSSILTPVIDPSIPSDKLIVVAKKAHQKEAELLLSIARTRGNKGEFRLLPESDATLDVKMALLDIFTSLDKEEGEVWLNATGGDRYHALAAFEVAREFDFPVFVVEPDHDSLFWLYPESREATPIQDKLKLHEYFTLFDTRLERTGHGNGIPAELKALGAKWASDVDYYGRGLRTLNYLAMKAENDNRVAMDESAQKNPALLDMLDELEALNFITVSDNRITFRNEKSRFFCNGGWLKTYVFSLLRGLTSEIRHIQDHTYSAEITRKVNGREVKNELDAVALVNNKLHILECKTSKMEDSNVTAMLYKLDSLNELIGDVRGRAALITYHDVNDSVLARAAELRIRVFGPRTLGNLKNHLKNWLREA